MVHLVAAVALFVTPLRLGAPFLLLTTGLVGLRFHRCPCAPSSSQPRLARFSSWGVLAFECSFPIALLDIRAGIALLALASGFHLANALILGLNRFFWAWVSAFPALLYWSARAGEP